MSTASERLKAAAFDMDIDYPPSEEVVLLADALREVEALERHKDALTGLAQKPCPESFCPRSKRLAQKVLDANFS